MAASTAPTAAVAPVATVRNFLRLASISGSGSAIAPTSVMFGSLYHMAPRAVNLGRRRVGTLRKTPGSIALYTTDRARFSGQGPCRNAMNLHRLGRAAAFRRRQHRRRPGAGVRHRVPASAAAAAPGGRQLRPPRTAPPLPRARRRIRRRSRTRSTALGARHGQPPTRIMRGPPLCAPAVPRPPAPPTPMLRRCMRAAPAVVNISTQRLVTEQSSPRCSIRCSATCSPSIAIGWSARWAPG